MAEMKAQIGQLLETNVRREPGQLPSQPMPNPQNYPPGFQQEHVPPTPQGQFQQGPNSLKGPQFEKAKAISALRSDKILSYPYQTDKSNQA